MKGKQPKHSLSVWSFNECKGRENKREFSDCYIFCQKKVKMCNKLNECFSEIFFASCHNHRLNRSDHIGYYTPSVIIRAQDSSLQQEVCHLAFLSYHKDIFRHQEVECLEPMELLEMT